MATKRDYYETLGINKDATDKEIKSAFRRLAKEYHPDVNKAPDAEAKFKEVQEAYAILSDESKKRQYDQYGHSAFDQTSGNYGGFSFDDIDLSSIFDGFFGSSFNTGFGGRNQNRARKGSDTLYKMSVTFDEAVFGCEKDIRLNVVEECDECHGKGGFDEKECPDCHGRGVVQQEQRTLFGTYVVENACDRCHGKGKTYTRKCSSCSGMGKIRTNKTITVTVPAGVDNGNQLRIPNKGEAGANGGPNGDLYIEFKVGTHLIFVRDEDDIYFDLPLTITEAVLGTKKEVPTLYGNIILNIPEGTQNGDKHRLKGKGVENVSSKRKGDMYIIVKVIMPRKLDRSQKKLLEQLARTDMNNGSEFKLVEDYIKKNK